MLNSATHNSNHVAKTSFTHFLMSPNHGYSKLHLPLNLSPNALPPLLIFLQCPPQILLIFLLENRLKSFMTM
jgi:hypothetical protein